MRTWALEFVILSPGQTVLPTQANSSQVTKSKLASVGRQTVPPSWVSSQKNHFNGLNFNLKLVWLRPSSYLTIKKQLGESWPKWPNGGNLCSSWAKIWVWSNSNPLERTRAKWVAKTIPNSIQVEHQVRVGLSWELYPVSLTHNSGGRAASMDISVVFEKQKRG